MKKSKYIKSSKDPPESGEGQKWTTLLHSGVIFPPLYKPHGVKILYKGQPVDLTPEQEEVLSMWTVIYQQELPSKEKKKVALKEEKMKLEEKYMWAVVDGQKEKVGNFRVEPPGLFRGRGEHPKVLVIYYLIDKLALRAGNEKDDDEADTVGCCTLKVFDFLGKDSIRYQNEVEVELSEYKAIQQFRNGKRGSDDLFDKLDTSKLNAHLKELMPGLTAKVFRTYNASITLDEMLSKETEEGYVAEKIAVYQHANKEVAIICNHQHTVSKSHSAQMSKLNEKIDELEVAVVEELESDLSRAKKGKPPRKNTDGKPKRNLNPEA
ncbi:hypothetical protein RJ639_010405 [Escallonia herrerae]|uniref:DNA topoisomerase I eukaryotic-type domain-containing protein n=1 Tax=Escallonia herrerae TaxID=1293975 RepID=A0AA88VS61_9ASTE|nr:hypothetical protein RJ639_010405 [Escallonia herrerae]